MLLSINPWKKLALIATFFFLLCSIYSALWGIEVNGLQTGTWSLNNSPYLVTGNIVIPENGTLIIEPGVVVKFGGYYEMKVSGTLIAKGNVGKRIIFTSIHDKEFGITAELTRLVPTPKDWQSIEFAPSSRDLSKLDHCIIRYSDKVITATFANPSLMHLIIADCNASNFILNGKTFVIQTGSEQDYLASQESRTPTPVTPDRPYYETGPEQPISNLLGPVEQAKEAIYGDEEFTFGELTVYSAARRAQKISEAPAAISVITEEDIKQAGAVTIPDILRMVPGLDVMQISASDLVVNARGYNKEMANKMLILIDGRYVYWDFYGITLWDSFPIVLEDIDRIEIIRGPGSALYGANAFSGVINIITKSPEDAQGTHVAVTGGQMNTYLGSLIHAGSHNKLGYKFTFGFDETNQWYNHDIPSRANKKAQASLQYNFNEHSKLAFETGFNKGQGETLTGIGRVSREQKLNHIKLDYTSPNFSTRLFWSRTRGDLIQYPTLNDYHFLSNSIDFESQLLFNMGNKNTIVIGGNFRYNIAESNMIDKDHTQQLMAGYIHDEFKPSEKLALTVGIRYDSHPLVEAQITPRANMIFSPFKGQHIRLSYGTAFRSPAFIESYLHEDSDISKMISSLLPANTIIVKSRGNPNLKPEKITSFELGYQLYVTSRLRMKTDLFYNELSDFISFKTVAFQDISAIIGYPPGSVIVPSQKSYTNASQSKGIGGEVGIDLLAAEWLKATFNYSYQKLTWEEDDPETSENETGQVVKTSPQHKLNFGLRFQFKSGFSANFQVHYVDQTEKYETWAYGKVRPYALVNSRVGYRFLNDKMEIAVAVFNLFNKKHYEYPGLDSSGNPNGGHEIGQRITSTFLSYSF